MAINRRRRRRKKDVFEPEEYMPKQVISFTDLEESLKDDGGQTEVSDTPDEKSTSEESPKAAEKGFEEKLADFSIDDKLLNFSEEDLTDIPVDSAFIPGKYSSGKKEEKHKETKEEQAESMKLEEFLTAGEPSGGLGFAELSTAKKVKKEISDDEKAGEDRIEESLDLDEEEESAFKVSMELFSIPQADFKSMLTDDGFQDDLLSQLDEEEEEEVEEEIIEEEIIEEEIAEEIAEEIEIAEEAKTESEVEKIEEEVFVEETPEAEEASEEEVIIEEVIIEEVITEEETTEDIEPEYKEEVVEVIIAEEVPETEETIVEYIEEEPAEQKVEELVEEVQEPGEYSEEGETEIMEEIEIAEEEVTEPEATEIPLVEETPVEEEIQTNKIATEEAEGTAEIVESAVEAELLHIMENKLGDEISEIRKQIGDMLLHLNTLDEIRGKMKGPIPDLKAFVEQLTPAVKVETIPEIIEIPIINVCEVEEPPVEKKAPEEPKPAMMPQVKVSMEKEITVFGDLIRSVPVLYFLKPGFAKAIFEPGFGYKEMTGMYRLASRYLKQELVNAQRNMEIIRTQFLNYKNQGAQLDFLLGSEEKPPAASEVIASPVDEGELFTLRETIKKKDNLIGRQQIQLDKMHLDFANARARQQKDIDHKVAKFQESIVGDLLKVVDDFELSMNFARQGSHDENLIKGFKMTFDGMKNILKKYGLEEIPAMGEKFDPNIHESLMNEETNRFEDGYVMMVLRKGYTLNENVLRPTQVKVASNSSGIVIPEEPEKEIELDTGMANGYQLKQGDMELDAGMANISEKSGKYELDSGMATLE